ncbi:thioredoxin family protein [Paenibacillus sp. WLX2291]|uniref:thioredoxin family protein n=1 Tax=Paenibacillus sp. WLX2291 TaxID=3296934 RepID=UPI003983E8A6
MQSFNCAAQIDQLLQSSLLTIMLFKTKHCSVCEAVQPQLVTHLQQYPHIGSGYLYMEDAPELASAYMIFTSPVVLLFYEGEEVYRAARFIRFAELDQQLQRYSSLLDS